VTPGRKEFGEYEFGLGQKSLLRLIRCADTGQELADIGIPFLVGIIVLCCLKDPGSHAG
jgi:hypothetical protein